ncbi:MAG: fatty acid desaturase [Phycisphaeraceae bacterium]
MSAQTTETTSEPFDPWAAPPGVPLSRKDLNALKRRSDAPGLRFLAGHLAIIAMTGLVIFSALRFGSWPLTLLAMLLHGSVMVFLFAPMHECTHGTAFRRRWINSAVGTLCGFVLFRPALYFKWRHAAHHSYTQDPERDPDIIPMPENWGQYLGELMGMRLWPKLVGTLYRGITGRFTDQEKEWIPETERGRVSREARLLLASYTLVAVVSVALGSLVVVWYWLLPRTLAEPVLRMVRMVEHTGMDEGPDPMTNTRTTKPNPVVQFLYWNMPYHAEHHLAPSVPFHALPKMHAQLPVSEAPPSILRAHREIIRNIGKGNPSSVARRATGGLD